MNDNQNVIDETLSLVQDAQKQGVFNLVDAIKGRSYPQKVVTVYTDAQAAYALVQLDIKMKEAKAADAAYAELEAEADVLAKAVQGSRIDFHMQGVSQAEIEKADEFCDQFFGITENKDRSDNWYMMHLEYLVAKNITKVVDANGNVDERVFSQEDVAEIHRHLPSESWNILVATMQKLTLATGFFNGLTNAGFLPKS